jgi:hypothetical protein
VDVEVHRRVIMRIRRHEDVSMTFEIDLNARADGAARRAPRAGGAPSVRRSNLVVVAVLAVFLLLYWQQRGPHHFWCGPLTCGNTVGVTGFEPAASSSRTKRATKLRHTPWPASYK